MISPFSNVNYFTKYLKTLWVTKESLMMIDSARGYLQTNCQSSQTQRTKECQCIAKIHICWMKQGSVNLVYRENRSSQVSES